MSDPDQVRKMLVERLEADMERMLFHPPSQHRDTALAIRNGSLVVIEFDDAGNEIVPPSRCPHCGPILLCSKHAGA